MAQLKPEKIDLLEINNGNEYNNGDGVDASTINATIKASAYAQALATNEPRYIDDGTSAIVEIEEKTDGTPRLVFKNIGSNGATNVLNTFANKDTTSIQGGIAYLDKKITKPVKIRAEYRYEEKSNNPDNPDETIQYGGALDFFPSWQYPDIQNQDTTSYKDFLVNFYYSGNQTIIGISNNNLNGFILTRVIVWTTDIKQIRQYFEEAKKQFSQDLEGFTIRFNGEITTIRGDIETLGNRTNDLGRRVITLENKKVDFSEIQEQIDGVKSDLSNETVDIRSKIKALEDQVTELENKEVDLSPIEERLDGINDEIQGIHKDIDITIGGEIDTLTNEVNALKNLIGDLEIPMEMQINGGLATVPYRITKPTRIKGEISSLQGDTTPDQATELVYSFDTEVKWKNPNDYTQDYARVVGVGDISYSYTVNSDNSVETKIKIENAETQDGYQEFAPPEWKSLTVYAKRK